MQLKTLVENLNNFLEKNPDLADQQVFLWDEHGEKYIGFDNYMKFRHKAFVEKGEDDTNQLGEEEVFFTVKDYKDFIGDSKITKKDLAQIILL
ncbi:MAG: hypothetical protein RSA22_13915 [Acinetobacter sp.]|jgi:hypothetical protein